MSNQFLLGLALGLFIGANLGVLLMALMAVAKRFDPVEVELERKGGFKWTDIMKQEVQ